MTTTPETLTVNNTSYVVVMSNTPESLEAQGLYRVAQDLRQKSVARQLFVQRPAGRKIFIALQGVNGNYSSVTAI